jgi:hypothetical protein
LFYTPRGRRGITLREPAGFEELSHDQRDLVYPGWRADYEDRYRAFSTIPFKQWPIKPFEMSEYCEQWCIRRDDLASWYRASPLSAGAPLESFWPAKGGISEPQQTRAAVVEAPKRKVGSQGRPRGRSPQKLKRAMDEMKNEDPKKLDQMLEKELESKWGHNDK